MKTMTGRVSVWLGAWVVALSGACNDTTNPTNTLTGDLAFTV
jgi:hypothetical protein